VTALLEFICHRPIGGYRIVRFDLRKIRRTGGSIYGDERPTDFTDDEQRFVDRWGYPDDSLERARIIHLLEPLSPKCERFDLFESAPGLFLEFAHTPTTPEGVKAFADQYGGLGGGADPERIDHWYDPIRQMARAVAAWDKAKSTGNFENVIQIIRRRARYRLFAEFLEDVGEGITANVLLKMDRVTKVARLCIRPEDLLDALWIQLALAIDGNQNLRPCAECHTWFRIETGGGRSDKEYCSDACRMRAYRRRKTERTRSAQKAVR
jgi:hypothetical protein